MFSLIMTTQSNSAELEKIMQSVKKTYKFSIIDCFPGFLVAVETKNISLLNDIIHKEDNSIILVVGSILNKLELQILVQEINPLITTHNDSQLFYELYKHFGDRAVSFLEGSFTVILFKNKTLKFFTNSSPTYPLYYYNQNEDFWISNEAKLLSYNKKINMSLKPLSAFNPSINLAKNFTIFKYLKKLPPNSYLECKYNQKKNITIINSKIFNIKLQSNFLNISEKKCAEILDYLMHTRIINFISNIKDHTNIGLALSGGIDSSLIAAYIKKINPQINIHSFTLGTKKANEFYYAKVCSEFVGTTHHEIITDERTFIDGLLHTVYFNEVFDAFSVEVYATMNSIYSYCRQYTQTLLTGFNADNFFGGNLSANISGDEINKKLLANVHRSYWSGVYNPYLAYANDITEYHPYLSPKIFTIMYNLNPSLKIKENTDKYILKYLAEQKGMLPKENIWRPKIRFEQGTANDLMFSEFLEIQPESYKKKHLFIYSLFELLFDKRIPYQELDLYELKKHI